MTLLVTVLIVPDGPMQPVTIAEASAVITPTEREHVDRWARAVCEAGIGRLLPRVNGSAAELPIHRD